MRKRPRSSIHRKKVVKDSNKYRSGFEKTFARESRIRKVPFEFESEQLEWIPPKRKYTPDFIYIKKDGEKMYVETKGRLTVSDRTKMRCIKEQHPDKDIRIIFQNANNKIYSGSTTTYSQWAEKHGYRWAEKEMPKAWFK